MKIVEVIEKVNDGETVGELLKEIYLKQKT